MDREELRRQVAALPWYHTLDLGQGVVTPGFYDHRPYLAHYGLPPRLEGKTALDVGAASGFFSFELERRGARVTAVDLPTWHDHDFGPCYKADMDDQEAQRYLREPIMLARQALGSQIGRLEMNIYDLSPEVLGTFDLVFCGSLLLHLTDPAQALWRLKSVTGEQAIIATSIDPDDSPKPIAVFSGHHRGDVWWHPNRRCLEAMIASAGFAAWEWVSTFRLDFADGRPGAYHGVIRAWNVPPARWAATAEGREETVAGSEDEATALRRALAESQAEAERLRSMVTGYQQGRVMRLMTGIQRRLRGSRPS
jgi:tRNA (mo5U34)-methyltransferase